MYYIKYQVWRALVEATVCTNIFIDITHYFDKFSDQLLKNLATVITSAWSSSKMVQPNTHAAKNSMAALRNIC